MEMDHNGLEVLGREECLRLLATATLGRIGVSSGALPAILPVNFWLDGDRILVHTGEGSKLAAASRNAVVAFEVDDFDPLAHTGWSVLVVGTSEELADGAAVGGRVPRWAPHGGGHWMAISTELVSGRRITHHLVPAFPRRFP